MKRGSKSLGTIVMIGVVSVLLLLFAWSYSAEKALGTGPLIRTARGLIHVFPGVSAASCRIKPGAGQTDVLVLEYATADVLPPADRSEMSKAMGEMAYFGYSQDKDMIMDAKLGRIRSVEVVCREETGSGCSRDIREISERVGVEAPPGGSGPAAPPAGSKPAPAQPPPKPGR